MPPELQPCSRPVIDAVQPDEWEIFLDWAGQEGWQVPAVELELYRGRLADSAFVARDGHQPVGFVTVCDHATSGWIGNLIIHPQLRRQGIGQLLFEQAIVTLAARGVETVWLTASAQGLALYCRYGFVEIDRVERWQHAGIAEPGLESFAAIDPAVLLREDRAVWGESRARLLEPLAATGQVAAAGRTVALLQGTSGRRIIGPWLSIDNCPRENRLVLSQLLVAARGSALVLDVLAGSPVRMLLTAAGFSRQGGTVLMARGPLEGVRRQSLVALASLGSMG